MKAQLYQIQTLTNLHVGSGDTNFGVIDNLVQRDTTTDLPTINGSSLKGALKEFFEAHFNEGDFIKNTFGDSTKTATFKFISAQLLAIPLRANKKMFYMATCPAQLKKLEQDSKNFGQAIATNLSHLTPQPGTPIIFSDTTDLIIEDFETFQQLPGITNSFLNCNSLVILNDEDFKTICNDIHLPVIARNEVGKNLWYEQVIPSATLFYFTLFSKEEEHIATFNEKTEDQIVFIGANSSVGYGLTKISKIAAL